MEDWKPGFEEEKALVEWSSIGDTRAENKAIKMDKIKRLVVSKSPGCDRFRLWMVGITTTMLLRWVLSSQSGDDIGTITAEVEAPPYFPPPRDYKNQGYLMVSCNGGFLNLTLVICDMVAIARFLNLTLVVPVLDIWDVDYFIKSLSSEVRIIKQLPPRLRKKLRQMDSIQCSPLAYYYNTVFPRFQKYEVVRFAKTDSRLGNNLAVEVQKMRCREKEIDPKSQREAGLCPLTPLETAFTLRAFNIDPSIQIYRAVGNIYGGNRRLASLKAFYPNLLVKAVHANRMGSPSQRLQFPGTPTHKNVYHSCF
ncbi:hypothetical protein E1A91_D13G098900v1 [Gossypium mustelinum]|uniref:O-fucosyltransferase family protein n=1 Tax=Gossypium mustelinum TaxID=34275 RepID=A0A5D2S0U6_GOSMU|nr:hypothetical protein E1A91_D13G098900v1 [Gossypium mustelinum]